MTESWDQMNERHKLERDQKLIDVASAAYQKGREGSGADFDAPETIAAITAIVAVKRGLTKRQMHDQTRAPRIAHARFEVFARAHELGFSLNQIGAYFGHMDHTSVLHGIRRHQELSA